MSYTDRWFAILNEVAEFQKGRNNTWFRGQNNISYKLNSGLYRMSIEKKNTFIATEKAYFEVFKRLGYTHLNKEEDWNILFIMQHHGVKTRLLDWTESFATALFFAVQDWDPNKNNAVVWLLDPTKLNELTLESEMFYTPKYPYSNYIDLENENGVFYSNTLALYPFRNSTRLVSQQGMFTLQGTCNLSLEEEFQSNLIQKNILKKIVLDEDLINDIHMYLKQGGTNDFSLFPDLDGLAKHVNKLGVFRIREDRTNTIVK